MRGFGIRIPREFPIRTSSIFMLDKLCNYIVIIRE
jgi:hypothetical protein